MAEFHGEKDATVEEIAIKGLRLKIPDVISGDKKFDDDLYLLQWLKVQKLNLERAESMIRKSIKWREENNVDSNLEGKFPPEFINSFKTTFGKSNDEEIPILYVNVGAIDLKRIVTSSSDGKQRVVQFYNCIYAQIEEKMIDYNRRKNVNTRRITSDCTSGIVTIVNIRGFSLTQLWSLDVIRIAIESVTNLMSYFPGIIGTAIYYNMNAVFKIILKAMKPLLAVPYLSLEVYGSDEKVWRERLLKVIDEDELKKLENQCK